MKIHFGIRSFTSSCALHQEAEYLINGTPTTRTQVLAMDPLARTVAQWSVLIDWDLQRLRNFVIVDPLDPTGLLYLNHAEYMSQSKVCASNDLPLIVVARPGTKGPVPLDPSSTSQNSPLSGMRDGKWTRSDRASWKLFLDLRKQVERTVNRKKGSKMVTESNATIARTVFMWVTQLLHYAEVKNPGIYLQYFVPLVDHLKVILAQNGQAAAITHLKVTLFALYSFVSGNPLKSTMPLGYGVRLTNGLPAIWDINIRTRIRGDNITIIRLMASILNIYRAMDAKHPEPDYGTIRKLSPNFEGQPLFTLYQKFCREVFPTLLANATKLGPKGLKFKYESGLGLLVRTAGANVTSPAMGGIIPDAKAWVKQPKNHILDWFQLHKDLQAERIFTTASLEANWGPELQSSEPQGWGSALPFMSGRVPKGTLLGEDNLPVPILGRLHTIEEAAGKVRIVAIADYWTQVAMKPVHDHLFKLLDKLASNDATFDQQGVVDKYFQQGLKPHWSFDLKAATDTIPLALYKEALTPLLVSDGETLDAARARVDLWASILTDRDWKLPDSHEYIRYGTGQPMGALSSWASMAMVHHSLVQFASWLENQPPNVLVGIDTVQISRPKARKAAEWYSNYLVLGDDIDIAVSGAVAKRYQDICASFSIIIGLAKSLQSDFNCFEFANQRFHPQGNISPLSLKEEITSTTWVARWEYAKRILSRFGTSLKDMNSALLRKAATVAQWRVMVPELSGLRPSTLVNLVKFCLLNPFSREELTGLRIASVLDWIRPVLSDEQLDGWPISVAPNDHLELERVVVTHISKEVLAFLTKLQGTVPIPFSVKGLYGNASDRGKALAPFAADIFLGSSDFPSLGGKTDRLGAMLPRTRLQKLLDGGFYPSVGYVNSRIRNAQFSVYYVLECFNKHNKKVGQQIAELLKTVQEEIPYIDFHFKLFASAAANGKTYRNTFGYWVDLYAKAHALSKPIHYDFDKSMSWNLDYNGAKDALEAKRGDKKFVDIKARPETIFGPMKSVCGALALQYGRSIPGLPFFSDGRRGGLWYRDLNRALAEFNRKAKLAEEARLSWLYYDRLVEPTIVQSTDRMKLLLIEAPSGQGGGGPEPDPLT
jgi:hypothetical protein